MSEAQMAHLRKWQMTAKYKRIPTAGIRWDYYYSYYYYAGLQLRFILIKLWLLFIVSRCGAGRREAIYLLSQPFQGWLCWKALLENWRHDKNTTKEKISISHLYKYHTIPCKVLCIQWISQKVLSLVKDIKRSLSNILFLFVLEVFWKDDKLLGLNLVHKMYFSNIVNF